VRTVVAAIAPFPFEAVLMVVAALAVIAVAYLVARRWW
jgi:hypothetical protein